MRTSTTRLAAVGFAAALCLGAVACGSDDDSSSGESSSPSTEAMSPTTEGMSEMADLTAANMGPGCAAVPMDGDGSFEGMADDPAATAASNNPALSTLVSAVDAAGLVDTLNGPGPFTIFAPSNDAFAAIDDATMDAVMADPSGDLTDILTLHVVQGDSWNAEELVDAGTVTTVNGAELMIELDGDTVMVDGQAAVVCGNVETANATVHIIDAVLMP